MKTLINPKISEKKPQNVPSQKPNISEQKYYVIFIKTDCRCWERFGTYLYKTFEDAEQIIAEYGKGHGGHSKIPNTNTYVAFDDSFEIVEFTVK